MRILCLITIVLAGHSLLAVGQAAAQCEDDLTRAGSPHQIARYARAGYGRRYVAYYVGGGARAPRGESRRVDEGTFGVDYSPIVPGMRRSVVLGWWHGKRRQGGFGEYEPNSPVSPFPALEE